jgi:hypothetical protein
MIETEKAALPGGFFCFNFAFSVVSPRSGRIREIRFIR